MNARHVGHKPCLAGLACFEPVALNEAATSTVVVHSMSCRNASASAAISARLTVYQCFEQRATVLAVKQLQLY